ncbi:MAG TPA: DNA polymerase III subunit beta [Novimethylophilus sp.]|jgi:DNA polymerase-3 subunit beta|uniref:DNA polymerase III subunit beta n=1 Tax=Novimethylophilus sp. TaxID=2137426 RepID=UPI002F3F04EA
MKININRDTLLKPLSAVNGIVERRHTLPILSNLLLEGVNGTVSLTATDLEMQISMSVENAATEPFATTVSAKKLLDICRSLPEGSEIKLADQDSRLQVSTGRSKFNLQTLPASDYPTMTRTPNTQLTLRMAQKAFRQLLRQVEFSMAQQDIRYYLNGLLLEVNGERLHVVGTDGHRLSYICADLEQSFDKQEIILPRKTVTELIKLLDDTDDEIVIEISSSQANFTFSNIRLISKVIDGKFPDYNRVIPVGHQNKFEINRLTVLQAMQRASILSNEKYRGIRMVLGANSLRLVSSNSEQEEAEEELEISYAGDPLDVGFNVTYLIDVLNNVQNETVEFSFADANSSCLVTIPDNSNYRYVVMPMRI